MYKLQKNNPFVGLEQNFHNTVANTVGLVIYSGGAGLLAVYIHPALASMLPNSPILVSTGTLFYFAIMYKGIKYMAKEVYHNFQKDRARVNSLYEQMVLEKNKDLESYSRLHKNELMKEFTRGDKLINIGLFQENPLTEPVETQGEERGFQRVKSLPGFKENNSD